MSAPAMVQLVRTDGRPTAHPPYELAHACASAKQGDLFHNGFYQAVRIDREPMYGVYTYVAGRGHFVARDLSLKAALTRAACERAADSYSMASAWRTIVTARPLPAPPVRAGGGQR